MRTKALRGKQRWSKTRQTENCLTVKSCKKLIFFSKLRRDLSPSLDQSSMLKSQLNSQPELPAKMVVGGGVYRYFTIMLAKQTSRWLGDIRIRVQSSPSEQKPQQKALRTQSRRRGK